MQSKIKNYLKSKRIKSLKKNYLSSFIIKLISLFLFFAIPKIILLNVSSDIYGLFIFILSLGAFFNLLDLGLGNSLRNKVTILNSQNKIYEKNKYVSTTYYFLIVFSSIILSFLLIFWNDIKWEFLYNHNDHDKIEINFLINLFIFYSIFSITLKNINYLLYSFHKSYLVDAIDVLAKLLFFVLLFLFYVLDADVQLKSLILAQIFSYLLIYILFNLYFLLKKEISLKLKFFSFFDLYKAMCSGIGFFLLQIASVILLFSDKILVSKYFPSSETTNYFLTGQIYIFQIMFFTFLNQPLWSSFTDAYFKNDRKWIFKTIVIELIILFIFIIFSFLIYLFSHKILELWVSNNVVFDQTLSLYWLMFVILRSANIIFTNFLNGANILKIQIFIAITIAIVNIPLSIYLAINFNLGSKGVLLGTIICLTFSLIVKSLHTILTINKINK